MIRPSAPRFPRIARKRLVFGAALLASAWGCAGGEVLDNEGNVGTAGSSGSRAAGSGGTSGASGKGGTAGTSAGGTAGSNAKGGAGGTTAGSAGKGGTAGTGGTAGAAGTAGKSGASGASGASGKAGGAGIAGAAGQAGAAGEAGAAGSVTGGAAGSSAGAAGIAGAAGTAGAAGIAGAAGEAGSGGAAGSGNTCTKLEDCPATSDVCLLRTCNAGICGTAPEAVGTTIAAQTAGDCKIVKCDANGVSVTQNDDADVPDDKNPCTKDTCVAGVKTFTSEGPGTNCGAALVCDGAGNCQGCVVDGDCPGSDDECRTRKCEAGVCKPTFAPQGTILTTQTAGDCKRQECDGSGAIVDVTLVTDVADDGKDCTLNTCNGQTPSFPAANSGTSCDDQGGSVCDGNGACVECVNDASCPASANECQVAACKAGKCGFDNLPSTTEPPTQAAGDCKKNTCDGNGNVVPANDDLDLPNDNNACTTDSCLAGVKTHLPVGSGTSCGGTQVCNATGQCVGCVTAASCPAGDECKTAVCAAGICGFTLALPGSATRTQVANDCKKRTCNALGEVAVVNDDTDAPVDDGKQCTSDVCSNGAIQHPPKTVNTACNQDGGSFCSASGTCVMCTGAAQCGTDTECKVFSCSAAGTCQQTNTQVGFAVASQTPADCKRNQCDGNGNIVVGNDDADLPTDANQCTDAICVNGLPGLPSSAINTACNQNGGTRCDGNGACVECTAAAQCGTDTNCKSFSCLAGGTCSQANVSLGTPVGSQSAGDCRVNTCDGNGNPLNNAIDDTDVPVDGNQCTGDVCILGVASNPASASGAVCNQNGGTVCNGVQGSSACVACVNDTQCNGATPKCTNNVCVAVVAVCGNGVKEGAEACDDNNQVNGDGCSSACAIEAGFTCTGAPSACCTGGLMFTQYYRGSSNNKFLEITNFTNAAISLPSYSLSIFSNEKSPTWRTGGSPTNSVDLKGSLPAGASAIIGNSSAATPTYATSLLNTLPNDKNGSVNTFTGDDTIVLWNNSTGNTFAASRIVDVLSFVDASPETAGLAYTRVSRTVGFNVNSANTIDQFPAWGTVGSTATADAAAAGTNPRLGYHLLTCP